MELTVRHPAPPVSMVPPVPKAAVSVNQAQLQSAQLAKKEEEGNGSSAHGVQNGSQNASLPAGSNDASVAPHDPLRYTITEPTPGVKAELTDAALGAGEETQGDAAVAAAEPVKPTIDATLAVEKKDSDSDSSDVSDDDDVDTSTWTNSIMSLYEDVRSPPPPFFAGLGWPTALNFRHSRRRTLDSSFPTGHPKQKRIKPTKGHFFC